MINMTMFLPESTSTTAVFEMSQLRFVYQLSMVFGIHKIDPHMPNQWAFLLMFVLETFSMLYKRGDDSQAK